MKIIVQLGLILLVLALSVAAARWLIAHRPRPPVKEIPPFVPAVTIHRVHLEERFVTVIGRGVARPVSEVQLSAEIPGLVAWMAENCLAGAQVAAGDDLVRLDDSNYQTALAMARNAAEQARRALAEERARAVQAEREWQLAGGGTADPLVLRKPQLAAAEAALAAAEAGVAKAEKDLARCHVRAPFAGRVRAKRVDLGAAVNTGQVLLDLYATALIEVTVPIVVEALADLHLGAAEADLSLPTGRDLARWHGLALRTVGTVDERTRTIGVVIRVADPQGSAWPLPLLPGMAVEARIAGRKQPGLCLLPAAAVQSQDRVYMVDDEDALRLRQVRILERAPAGVLVSGALTEGERVLASPLAEAYDGLKVAPLPDAIETSDRPGLGG